MAQHGWYPDPGGQPGMFRYWDGTQWSEVISPTPLPGPPSQFAAPGSLASSQSTAGGYDPTQPFVAGASYIPAAGQGAYGAYQTMTHTKPKKPVGPWIILGVGVVTIALVAFFIVRILSDIPGGGPVTGPGGIPTTQVCPQESTEDTRRDHPIDDRVYGGDLSYPMLYDPWSGVYTSDLRIPFGRDVASQDVFIHTNPSGKGGWTGWVTSIMVAELYAGDGFYDPQRGSEIVNRCIFGKFYGDQTLVTPETLRSEPYPLDGHDGWITETMLSFSIPNLPTTSELAIVIIIQTSSMSSSIFYASIPTDAMGLKPDVDYAIAGLRVTT